MIELRISKVIELERKNSHDMTRVYPNLVDMDK